MKNALIASALLCTITPVLAEAKEPAPSRRERAAMMMTPVQVAEKTWVEGLDELDPAIWVSTQRFLDEMAYADHFFRAKIIKSTGVVVYQMYIITNNYRDWFHPKTLSFVGAGGVESLEAVRIDYNAHSSRYTTSFVEDSIVTLTRAQLEDAAQGAETGATWNAKIFGDYTEGKPLKTYKTEIAGLLLAVDHMLASKHLKTAHPK